MQYACDATCSNAPMEGKNRLFIFGKASVCWLGWLAGWLVRIFNANKSNCMRDLSQCNISNIMHMLSLFSHFSHQFRLLLLLFLRILLHFHLCFFLLSILCILISSFRSFESLFGVRWKDNTKFLILYDAPFLILTNTCGFTSVESMQSWIWKWLYKSTKRKKIEENDHCVP